MASGNIDRLVRAGNLAPLSSRSDWSQIEQELRFSLPADYCDLIDKGGAGTWFQTIRLWAPNSQIRGQDIRRGPDWFMDLEEFWEDGDLEPPEGLGKDSRLSVWASTPNGEKLWWKVSSGDDPDDCAIFISDPDYIWWKRWDMGVAQFLISILDQEISAAIFTPDSSLDRNVVHTPARLQ